MLRTVAGAALAVVACSLFSLGGGSVAQAAPQFPNNSASQGQCQYLAGQIAELTARSQRADTAQKANRLQNQADQLAQQAANTGCDS
ncbi:hypothetical protein [Antrihabitans cavernicola]|uniref:DUF732 domain-containing protein n=1 Tax=Antrihabitans cavernicola TaxID=2495913 RepID=A0A5A7SK84_9NOCA|nr:hypothetical protein [Spelaeibacter cavernicola]KAA0024611.1 hypothetical protein FOY51_01260 [Spelaeibacter cavernicola]